MPGQVKANVTYSVAANGTWSTKMVATAPDTKTRKSWLTAMKKAGSKNHQHL